MKLEDNENKITHWKSALRKFENFRKSQKLSIESIFYHMNQRGTSVLPKLEFIDCLTNLIHNINQEEAISFAETVDNRHAGIITIQVKRDEHMYIINPPLFPYLII